MKKILLILGFCALAFVLAVAIFVLTFDINAYKPRIEAVASEATGMEVSINGKLKLIFFPHTGISLEDIMIRNQGMDLASAKKAELEIKLLSLFRRVVLIKRVRLITPMFFITKDRRGRFNFETPEKPSNKEFLMKPFEVGEIFIKGGKVLYFDEKSGGKIEANECDLMSRKFSDAVIKRFENIGEATKNVPEEIKAGYPEIPWKEMAGMRDKLVHFYFGVKHELVWTAVKNRIPAIRPLIENLLNDLESDKRKG